ncbi:MAG: PAS domain-containing protein [Candidatus Thorarchaeota archaeon]
MGHWDWDIVKNHISWSDEIYRIFGLAPQEFEATYEAFLNSVHEDDRQDVIEAVDKAIHENQIYSIDHRVLLRDGTVAFVHEAGEVTFDEEGILFMKQAK